LDQSQRGDTVKIIQSFTKEKAPGTITLIACMKHARDDDGVDWLVMEQDGAVYVFRKRESETWQPVAFFPNCAMLG